MLSERIAKSFNPTSTPTAEFVFGNSATSNSVVKEIKYLPEGFRLTVALRIRPSTSRLFANRTQPSMGNLIY